jgi:hypothetical protein
MTDIQHNTSRTAFVTLSRAKNLLNGIITHKDSSLTTRKEKSNQLALAPLIFIFAFLLTACGSTQDKTPPPPSPYTFVDSTLYFYERQSSISMRAIFNRDDTSKMAEGYKFQFRTISNKPVFISSISIVAGGKRIFLKEGQVVLPTGKGISLSLPLDASLFAAKFPSALVQFKHNNDSQIFSIELHQLKKFVP